MGNKSYKSGGRPSLPDYKKKKVSINVRLSPMEHAYITAMAKESGLRPAELARKAILDVKVYQPLTTDQWKAISAMNNFGNNLNQLARQGNIGEDVRPQADELIIKISSILKQLK